MSFGPNGLNAGYRGWADVNGTPLRFSDANITAKQEVEAPDLVMGDWDRDAYVFGKISVDGSISGPVTESFITGQDALVKWAAGRGNPCGELSSNDIILYYFCGSSRTFENLFVNNFNFSVAAGEIAQFSLDVVGTRALDFVTGDIPRHPDDAEKLLTWDKVSITLTAGDVVIPIDNQYSNFEFSVANNVEALYSLSQPDLFPFDIIPGLRSISGTLSVYNTPLFNGVDTFDDYCAGNEGLVSFTLDNSACGGSPTPVTMRVRFHRIEPTLSSGTIISTVGFTGVSHQSGFPWDL